MKNVTDQWRRRDGKPLIAVYEAADGELLVIHENGYDTNSEKGCWRGDEKPHRLDLLPVPREPTYRPFRDLREAFEVMGPTHWMRSQSRTWFVPTWNSEAVAIHGIKLPDLLESHEWTSNPSDTTGKPCGVEVTE